MYTVTKRVTPVTGGEKAFAGDRRWEIGDRVGPATPRTKGPGGSDEELRGELLLREAADATIL